MHINCRPKEKMQEKPLYSIGQPLWSLQISKAVRPIESPDTFDARWGKMFIYKCKDGDGRLWQFPENKLQTLPGLKSCAKNYIKLIKAN